MKNIDKEPTYYVSLTEYNEVKRMFFKANDEISKLKELLKEAKEPIELHLKWYEQDCGSKDIETEAILYKIKQVLGEDK